MVLSRSTILVAAAVLVSLTMATAPPLKAAQSSELTLMDNTPQYPQYAVQREHMLSMVAPSFIAVQIYSAPIGSGYAAMATTAIERNTAPPSLGKEVAASSASTKPAIEKNQAVATACVNESAMVSPATSRCSSNGCANDGRQSKLREYTSSANAANEVYRDLAR